jgi:hypothetical protein
LDDEAISARISRAELERLLVPESYLGSCQALVDQVLGRSKARQAEEAGHG